MKPQGQRQKLMARRKTDSPDLEDDLRPEYDFSKMRIVGRGIYSKRYRSGTNLVLLEPDIRKAFPDDESVNEALRVLAKAAKHLVPRVDKTSATKKPATRSVRKR
jgi:hypothetical protein